MVLDWSLTQKLTRARPSRLREVCDEDQIACPSLPSMSCLACTALALLCTVPDNPHHRPLRAFVLSSLPLYRIPRNGRWNINS